MSKGKNPTVIDAYLKEKKDLITSLLNNEGQNSKVLLIAFRNDL